VYLALRLLNLISATEMPVFFFASFLQRPLRYRSFAKGGLLNIILSTLHTCPHGIHRKNLTFTFIVFLGPLRLKILLNLPVIIIELENIAFM
jgi:hypothetical protein